MPNIIYQLSPSSLPILQQCVELTSQSNTQNQWNIRFSRNAILLDYGHLLNNTEIVQKNETQLHEDQEISNNATEIKPVSNTLDSEKYKEIIESNPITHIKYILKESMKNDSILLILARNLSDTNVEKMCHYVFENSLNMEFIEKFLLHFLLPYFERQNMLSIDILVKVHQHYPEQFKKIFQKMIFDYEIYHSILQEFVSMLTSYEITSILKSLIELDIPVDVFVKNIFTIYTMFKICLKEEKIQNFIFTKLEEAAVTCVADKQYGRLLLTFLQHENHNTKLINLQKVVEIHRSPFRRPCLNLLNEMIEKYN